MKINLKTKGKNQWVICKFIHFCFFRIVVVGGGGTYGGQYQM